jgi:polyhydroxyalkanoate synthesis regulator phasin
MLKRFASIIGAAALAFVVFAGCNDAPTSPDESSFDKAAISGQTGVSFDEQNLFRDPPTGDRGMRDPGMRNPGLSLERLVRILSLSERQARAMEDCLESHRECMETVNTRMRETRQELMEEFRERMAEIREAVEEGEMTRAEAREAIQTLSTRIRGALRTAMEQHRNGITRCKNALDDCVEEFLTEEQLAIWERLTTPRRRR